MVFFLSTNFMIIIILAATLLLHVACASDIHIFFSVIKDRRGGKVTEQRSIAEPNSKKTSIGDALSSILYCTSQLYMV